MCTERRTSGKHPGAPDQDEGAPLGGATREEAFSLFNYSEKRTFTEAFRAAGSTLFKGNFLKASRRRAPRRRRLWQQPALAAHDTGGKHIPVRCQSRVFRPQDQKVDGVPELEGRHSQRRLSDAKQLAASVVQPHGTQQGRTQRPANHHPHLHPVHQ